MVDAELIFNNATTLPNASSAIETLTTAVSSGNLSLSVNTSSITATGKINHFHIRILKKMTNH